MPVSIPAERMECVNGREAPVLTFLEKARLWGNLHNNIISFLSMRIYPRKMHVEGRGDSRETAGKHFQPKACVSRSPVKR